MNINDYVASHPTARIKINKNGTITKNKIQKNTNISRSSS